MVLVPIPPLCAPRPALPPPVSLIPRDPVVPLLRARVVEADRDPAPERVEPLVVRPAVSSIIPDESSPIILSVQSPI